MVLLYIDLENEVSCFEDGYAAMLSQIQKKKTVYTRPLDCVHAISNQKAF